MQNNQPTRRIGIKGYLAAATLPQGLLFLSLLTGGLLPAYYWLLSRTSTPFGSLVLTMVALAVASVTLVQLFYVEAEAPRFTAWSEVQDDGSRRVFIDWKLALLRLAGVVNFPALYLLADFDAVRSALRELGGAPEFVVIGSTLAVWVLTFAAAALSLARLMRSKPTPPCSTKTDEPAEGKEEGVAPSDETQAITPAQTNA